MNKVRPHGRRRNDRPPFSTPSLDAWLAEMARGQRAASTADWLREAAGWESSALDAWRAGFHGAALDDVERARAVVVRAAEVAA